MAWQMSKSQVFPLCNDGDPLRKGPSSRYLFTQGHQKVLGIGFLAGMANRRCCQCPDDDEFVRYQPTYVQTYLDNRQGAEQTIEEWTRFEGSDLFATSDIYRPISLAVALSGTEHNAFEVDMARPDWYGQLEGAVRTALVRGGLAKEKDKVALENVRREPVNEFTRHQLERTGTLYASVNGQRTVDSTRSKQAGLGCELATPLTHSPTKEAKLVTYTADLFNRAGELLIAELAKSADLLEVNKRVSSDGDDGVKKVIADLIMRDAGSEAGGCTELNTFDRLVEAYADTLALEALKRGDLTTRTIAERMATHIVDQVATQMQTHYSEVESFYQARQLGGQAGSKQARTIFAPGSALAQNSARIESIMRTYPRPEKLHRMIIANALDKNERLARSVIASLKNSIPIKQRQRIAARYEAVGHWVTGADGRRHHVKEGGDGDYHRGSHHHHHKGKGKERKEGHRHHHAKMHAQIGANADVDADPDPEGELRNAALVRAYVMSGLVPPEFELDSDVLESTPAPVAAAIPAVAKKPEPPSLEPVPRAIVKASVRTVVEPPSLEPIPKQQKAVGAQVPVVAKPAARIFAEPPSMERIPVAAAVTGAKSQPPPLEMTTSSKTKAEPASLEAMFQRPKAVAAKTSPAVPPQKSEQPEALPSLDRLFRLAAVKVGK